MQNAKPKSGLESLVIKMLGIDPAEMQRFATDMGNAIKNAAADIKGMREQLDRIERRLDALNGHSARSDRVLANGHDPARLTDGSQPAHAGGSRDAGDGT